MFRCATASLILAARKDANRKGSQKMKEPHRNQSYIFRCSSSTVSTPIRLGSLLAK